MQTLALMAVGAYTLLFLLGYLLSRVITSVFSITSYGGLFDREGRAWVVTIASVWILYHVLICLIKISKWWPCWEGLSHYLASVRLLDAILGMPRIPNNVMKYEYFSVLTTQGGGRVWCCWVHQAHASADVERLLLPGPWWDTQICSLYMCTFMQSRLTGNYITAEPEIRCSRYISLHFLGDTSTKGTTSNFIVFTVDAGLLKTALCDEKTCRVYFKNETSNK